MIPAFLQSLAATVRDLVRTGKAVHVNESTAQELDLLAGLPWEHAGDGGIPCALKTAKIEERCHWCRTRNRITPADIALGWLLASRAATIHGGEDEARSHWQGEAIQRAAECAELALIAHKITVAREIPGAWKVHELADAHVGTRDGARAAWSFICASMQQYSPDRYRRELEAM